MISILAEMKRGGKINKQAYGNAKNPCKYWEVALNRQLHEICTSLVLEAH